MHFIKFAAIIFTSSLLTACMNAKDHREAVTAGEGPSTFTLGKIQSTIYQGMPQAQVVAALGAPNIVTTDERGYETWVYDKVSTEGAYSTSKGGFFDTRVSGAYARTQKTLTVMIKFDAHKYVQSIDYHQSKF